MLKNSSLDISHFSRYISLTSYLVLFVMLMFSVTGWYLAKEHFLAHQSSHFEESVYRTEQRIQQRMNHYGDILKASASLFNAANQVTPSEFKVFINELKITQKYPGMQAMGYIRRVNLGQKNSVVKNIQAVHRTQPCGYPKLAISPEGKRPEYMFVALVEPIAKNKNFLGKDMLMEPACKQAMETARDTGKVTASRLITLSRDEQDVRAFTLVIPIYDEPLVTKMSLQQRHENLQGFVFASFVGIELFRGIFGERVLHDIDFEVFDGSGTTAENLIYDDDNVLHAIDVNYPVSYSRTSKLHIFGNQWYLYFTAPPSFHNTDARYMPSIVLYSGVVISLLLFGLAQAQARSAKMKFQHAAKLEYQATHDSLTQLPNRFFLYQRLNELFSSKDASFALLILDLDGFKEINDTLGHHSGDLLLLKLAQRLKQYIDDKDMLVRLGGDEFAIIYYPISNTQLLIEKSQQVMQNLRQPFVLEDVQVQVDGSAGLVIAHEHGNNSSELLRHADVAMYAAKRNNDDLLLYKDELDQHNPRQLQLVSELSNAIEKNELELYYQPKLRLSDDVITGVEALIRWHHPRYGLIPPDDFIPQAENCSIIKPLTLWVIRAAIKQYQTWRKQNIELNIAVNISARNLMDHQLPEQIDAIIKSLNMDPKCLELEVTESSIIADAQSAEIILTKLHESGFKISIDDFGTGYTSIGHLKNMPISTLKIDKVFVTHLEENDDDAVIVHSVTRLAHNLGQTVIAEGVEDSSTLQTLKMINCDYAQGYFVCRPKPASELTEWIKNYNKNIKS